MSKCRHCYKDMDKTWWQITKGYCYMCRRKGFSYSMERACGLIFRLLRGNLK